MCAALLVHTMYGLVPRASITLSMPPHLGSLLFPAASFRKLIKNITSGLSDFAKPKKRTEKQCIIFFFILNSCCNYEPSTMAFLYEKVKQKVKVKQ